MTVREHLMKFHKAAHEHHTRMAKLHRECGQEGFAKCHEDHAALHEAMCGACSKATEADLEKTMPLPAGLSVVIPSDAPLGKLVPRVGQHVDTTAVDPQFKHLVEI